MDFFSLEVTIRKEHAAIGSPFPSTYPLTYVYPGSKTNPLSRKVILPGSACVNGEGEWQHSLDHQDPPKRL